MFLLAVAPVASQCSGGDVQVMISEAVVEKVALAVFPVTAKGSVPIGIGFLQKRVDYVAEVRNPKIRITKDSQTFQATADVRIPGNPLPITVPITGDLSFEFKKEDAELVIDVRDVVILTQIPPFNLSIDVSREIKGFPIRIGIPSVEVGLEDKTVEVHAKPDLTFKKGGIVLDVDLELK